MAAKEEKSKAAPAKAATAVKKPAARRTTTTRKTKAPEITDAMIAERAYFLSLEGEGAIAAHGAPAAVLRDARHVDEIELAEPAIGHVELVHEDQRPQVPDTAVAVVVRVDRRVPLVV